MRFKLLITIIRLATIVLLLFMALESSLNFHAITRTIWNPENIANDPVSTWEKRAAELRSDLPKRGQVGYLAEWDIPNSGAGISDQDNEYRLVQYILAPLIVQRGANHDRIVGNFGGSEYDIEKIFGVKILAYYGNGLYLLKGPGR